MDARFSLGRVVITPGALSAVARPDIDAALRRHQSGDWGELDTDDRRENDRALGAGCRLLSAYTSAGGVTFWIITEADRSATTILLPDEY